MKRLLLLVLITVIGVIKISAQEIDLSQENSTDARIEELTQEVAELSERLDKLQEDYNFLSFENIVKELVFRTEIFDTDLKISINDIQVLCYNGQYDKSVYYQFKENYNLSQKQYDIFLDQKEDLSNTILNLPFSSARLDIINLSLEKLNADLEIIEDRLQIYLDMINIYYKTRFL
ncbi:MAG: hypothetical protein IJD53_00030 [Alistipes sp.]|nr:hypothetical protein [Alistipes sp.]